jgi:mannosyltransferase OCH1-like enzyme
MIPKNIYYYNTFKLIPDEITNIMEQNKKKCPNYSFITYNEETSDYFIKTNFNNLVYKAYNLINPKFGAMKADFFRYCILFINGGIYLDIKSVIITDLDLIIKNDDLCLLDLPRYIESWRVDNNCPTYEQWILFFSPNHLYLKNMIDMMTFRILNKYEPIIFNQSNIGNIHRIMFTTGPDALAEIINKYINKTKCILHRHIDYNLYFKHSGYANYKEIYKLNKLEHYRISGDSIYNDYSINIDLSLINFLTLGINCIPAINLKNLEMRKYSLPFDYIISNKKSIIDCLNNDFKQLHTNLIQISDTRLQDSYGFIYVHDYPFINSHSKDITTLCEESYEEHSKIIPDYKNYINDNISKYKRRSERFNEILKSELPIIALHINNDTNNDNVIDIEEIDTIIKKLYNKTNIIYITNSDKPSNNLNIITYNPNIFLYEHSTISLLKIAINEAFARINHL